jgi:hypothetical protein
MTLRRAEVIAVSTAAAALFIWALFVGVPRWYASSTPGTTTSASSEPAAPGRKIKARLFYVSADGTRLASAEHDVPYGEGTLGQAKAIVAAQLETPPESMVSAVPEGTKLRALFVTANGEAYADFSGELTAAHPGGSLNELLTVYTLVSALTVNLPAITAVQILVDGKEVDTLAGHVDVRRPLVKNLAWVE